MRPLASAPRSTGFNQQSLDTEMARLTTFGEPLCKPSSSVSSFIAPKGLGTDGGCSRNATQKLKSLAALTGRDGPFKGYFTDCYGSNRLRNCPLNHSKQTYIPVPPEYMLTDDDLIIKHVTTKGFNPEDLPWQGFNINAAKMEIYVDESSCPDCAVESFVTEVEVYEESEREQAEMAGRERSLEQLYENIRYHAQRREAILKGTYQSLWRPKSSKRYRELKKKPWGKWKPLPEQIAGQRAPAATHVHRPFIVS
ncbi:MAG: hypothetical protein Q9227_009136 [Pyrenula ochraceoflavens]